MTTVDINSMNGNHLEFSYNMRLVKENSKSIYAQNMYGDTYKIEKKTKKVFYNGKQIADTCEYFMF